MRQDIIDARSFIKKLKSFETSGQGCGYPFSYVYEKDFENLEMIINTYEKLVEFICDEIDKCRYFDSH